MRPSTSPKLLYFFLFQSTHPRGMRHCTIYRIDNGIYISIHASAWDATIMPVAEIDVPAFQSTHPRGMRRDSDIAKMLGIKISIHASAWDATSKRVVRSTIYHYFNPRIHVGCDLLLHLLLHHHLLFQSTHPRGMRRCQVSTCWT